MACIDLGSITFGTMNRYLTLLWFGFAVSSILPARSYLDLRSGPLPPDADIYNGTFSDGGLYRMIVLPNFKEGYVQYGSTYIRVRNEYFPYKLCVEEYRRSDTVILELIIFYKADQKAKCYATTLWMIEPSHDTRIKRHHVTSFLGGFVWLKIDMAVGAKLHPYIRKVRASDGGVVRYSVNDFPKTGWRIILRSKYYYRITSIINSDLPKDSNNCQTSIVAFPAHSVTWKQDGGKFNIVAYNEGEYQKYYVDSIKGIIMGIDPSVPSEFYWKPWTALECVSVTIDVGAAPIGSNHLLVVYNVPKGDWLYSRYEVILYADVRTVRVLVHDTMREAMIYQSPSDVLVTHVETYCNYKENLYLVDVHLKQANSAHTSTHRKIFQRLNEEGKTIYPEHYKLRKKVYEEKIRAVLEHSR